VSARLELHIAFDINAKAGRMKEKPNESESDRKHEKFRRGWGGARGEGGRERKKGSRRRRRKGKRDAQTRRKYDARVHVCVGVRRWEGERGEERYTCARVSRSVIMKKRFPGGVALAPVARIPPRCSTLKLGFARAHNRG